jgi:hypothetical protein
VALIVCIRFNPRNARPQRSQRPELTFTFDKQGKFLRFKDAEGYPKDKPARIVDATSKNGVSSLIEDFFQDNFRDITSRETLEWGELEKKSDGDVSLRYKYRAKIWDKDTVIKSQVFTFSSKGEFVSVEDLNQGKEKPLMLLKRCAADFRSAARG